MRDFNWHPTEQIPERVIGSAVCSNAYCSLDPSAGGDTSRWILSSQITAAEWTASAYIQHYDWYMQSNPTYDFQINQFDKRITTGGRYDRTLIQEQNIALIPIELLEVSPVLIVAVPHRNFGSGQDLVRKFLPNQKTSLFIDVKSAYRDVAGENPRLTYWSL